jgi:hypothetical protein
MMRHGAACLPVLAGILAGVCVRPALAADASCAAVAIEATASVTTRWPGLLEEVREAFEARDDIDRCARVALTAHDASITVEVVLPDGRSAGRPVSRREDVLPTLEALLLVPRRTAQAQPLAALDAASPASPPARSPSKPPEESPRPRAVPSVGADRDSSTSSPERRARRVGIELSVLTGARIGDGQSGFGLGALSFVDLSGWLVGFEGRADAYKPLSGGPTGDGALELAVLAGRRFRFHDVALDLTAGGAAAMQGTSTYTSQSPITGTGFTASSSSTVPRLLLGARVDFGALSMLHTFVGIDGDFGPARVGDTTGIPNVPRLPLWTLGLALGATVGTP